MSVVDKEALSKGVVRALTPSELSRGYVRVCSPSVARDILDENGFEVSFERRLIGTKKLDHSGRFVLGKHITESLPPDQKIKMRVLSRKRLAVHLQE